MKKLVRLKGQGESRKEIQANGDVFQISTHKGGSITSLKFEKSKTKGRLKREDLTSSHFCDTNITKAKKKKLKSQKFGEKRGICDEDKLRKEYCEGGMFMEWMDCDVYHQWFNYHCVGYRKPVRRYVCLKCSSKFMSGFSYYKYYKGPLF